MSTVFLFLPSTWIHSTIFFTSFAYSSNYTATCTSIQNCQDQISQPGQLDHTIPRKQLSGFKIYTKRCKDKLAIPRARPRAVSNPQTSLANSFATQIPPVTQYRPQLALEICGPVTNARPRTAVGTISARCAAKASRPSPRLHCKPPSLSTVIARSMVSTSMAAPARLPLVYGPAETVVPPIPI